MSNHAIIYEKLQKISTILETDVTNKDVSGAVTFLFVRDRLFLIKRSTKMRTHRAQIAFVGGHIEESDRDLKDTAFREFYEETNFESEHLEFFGYLPSVNTMRSKIITPVLCFLDEDPNAFIDRIQSNGEWSEAMLVNYHELMNIDLWSHGKSMTLNNSYNIMFRPMERNMLITTRSDENRDRVLWGATAKMIWDFHFNIWSKV
jgi:8-oxo-dGTP pyrophosphatase MutT (NUDIX family)